MEPPVDPLRIERLASQMESALSAASVRALASFGDLLLRWNAKINLGGRLSAEAFVERHLLDAFAASRYLPEGAHVVDVGSGGGLPAIPLAVICPGCSFELYEPTAKKVAFLRTAVRELGLGSRVRVHAKRIEGPLLVELAQAFDVACSRATLAPANWLQVGRQLVKPDGRILVFATHEAPLGLPVPSVDFAYAVDRRLLVF